MKYKDTTRKQREQLEILFKDTLNYLDIDCFSEEPYIQLADGTIIYLDNIELSQHFN